MTAPFLLRGRNHAWRITSGAVDLFLVDLANGEPRGARRHVRRADAGETLFGMALADGASSGLLAVPVPGGTLSVLTPEEAGLPALERWIDSLSQVAARHGTPNVSLRLEPGMEMAIEKKSQAVRAGQQLCWVYHRSGSSAFLGHPDLAPVAPPGWFPLSGTAWMVSEPGCELEAVDSVAWAMRDPAAVGLDEFHHRTLQALVLELQQADGKERRRLVAAAEKEAESIQSALKKLARPLQGGAVADDVEEESHHTLVAACRAVAKEMGVRIRVPRVPLDDVTIELIAEASALRMRKVTLRGDWWKEYAGPMVVTIGDDYMPLAMLRSGSRYRIWDPRDGSFRACDRREAETLGHNGWVFYRPFPGHAITLSGLLIFGLRGAGADLAMIGWVGLGSGLLGVLTPLATGIIFDQLIPGAGRTGLQAAAGFLAVAALVGTLFSLTSSYAILRVKGRMDAAIQAAVWDRLLSLPVPFFRDYTSGDLAIRSLAISEIREALTGSTISSLLSGIFSVFNLALMFYYSLPLALLGVALSIVACLVPAVLGYFQMKRYRVLAEVRGQLSGLLLQFLGGIAKLRVTGKEVRAFGAWATAFTRQKQEAAAARKLSNILAMFDSAYPVVCTGAVFYLASGQGQQLSTGQFLAFHAAFFGFLTHAIALSWAAISISSVTPLFERAKPILSTLPEVDAGKSEPGRLTGQIDLRHLFFRYRPDTPRVLNDLSLTIEPGQFVALVGASGCGKSTLFRMLLGFEKPEQGAVYFNGQDLATLHLPAVRRQIGVVLQNGKLQSGDIFSNIVGSLPLTIDDAWEAARMAGFEADLRAMPMGMHTVVSEGGGGLSGGQRQRLMIARAIVARPRILLFDEATSALDNQTQLMVSQSLERLQATRIVIAHRLSTIVNADQIYVLDAGRVAEAGTYSELLRQDGLFSRLAQRQLI